MRLYLDPRLTLNAYDVDVQWSIDFLLWTQYVDMKLLPSDISIHLPFQLECQSYRRPDLGPGSFGSDI